MGSVGGPLLLCAGQGSGVSRWSTAVVWDREVGSVGGPLLLCVGQGSGVSRWSTAVVCGVGKWDW